MSIVSQRLSKSYMPGSFALNEVSFEFGSKGIYSVIGRNGAGKTTLMRILATQLMPTSGSVELSGLDVVRQAKAVRELIASVPQEGRAIPWLTPLQSVSSYLMWRGYRYGESRRIARDVLRSIGLEQAENVKNRHLSGGTKRKVLVACVIASEAGILFLDEPTTGLDHMSRIELWKIMEGLGRERLIVLTTHYLDEAQSLSRKIEILSAGRLVAEGSTDELRKLIPSSFSVRVYDDHIDCSSITEGSVKKLAEGYQIFTSETNAYELSKKLIAAGTRFSMNPLDLDEIFESLVS